MGIAVLYCVGLLGVSVLTACQSELLGLSKPMPKQLLAETQVCLGYTQSMTEVGVGIVTIA